MFKFSTLTGCLGHTLSKTSRVRRVRAGQFAVDVTNKSLEIYPVMKSVVFKLIEISKNGGFESESERDEFFNTEFGFLVTVILH